jgi:hypothetical protein
MIIELSDAKGSLLKNLPNASRIASTRLAEGLNQASGIIWEKVQLSAPRATGTLQKSIRRELFPTYARIYPTEKYGLFVHEGTRPHWIPKAELLPGGTMYRWFQKKGITDKGHQYAILRSIARKGTKANPWAANAAKDNEGKAIAAFESVLNQIVQDLIS